MPIIGGKSFADRSDGSGTPIYQRTGGGTGGGGNLFFATAIFARLSTDPGYQPMSYIVTLIDTAINNYNAYGRAWTHYPEADDIDTTKQYAYISSGLDYMRTRPGTLINVASDSNLPDAESCVIGQQYRADGNPIRNFFVCIRQSKLVLFAYKPSTVDNEFWERQPYPTLPMCLQQI